MALAKILVIEDSEFTRSLLVAALSANGFEVVAQGSSALDAKQAVQHFEVEVALLDLDLGEGPTGIDVAISLRKTRPDIGIVFLTSFRDPRFSKSQSLQLPSGSRYLVKSESSDINKLITTILQSKFRPLKAVSTRGPAKMQLNNRQVEVLKLLAGGMTNHEIASQTETTEKAVEHSIARIFDLLELKKSHVLNSRVQLAKAFSLLTGREP